MYILKNTLVRLIKQTGNIAFPTLDGGFTVNNLMAYQWLNCSIASGSVKYLNESTPGFVEYGAYLKEVAKVEKSKLTINQVKNLLAYNEFVGFDQENNKAIYRENVDVRYSLMNKSNIDIIFSRNSSSSISFIKDNLQINDTVESTNLYNYLNYISGEMPFLFSKNGTVGIGGLTQLVAPYLVDTFNKLGFSLFFNWIKLTAYNSQYGIQNCVDVLQKDDLWPNAKISDICSNPNLDTKKMENVVTWIDGVLFGNNKLKSLLGVSDIDFLYLSGSNSKMKAKMMLWVNNFFTIYKDYIVGSDYRTANFMKLAALQWVSSKITKEFSIEKYRANSVSNENWDLGTFPGNFFLIYFNNRSS